MNKSVEVEADERGSRIELRYGKYKAAIRIENEVLKIGMLSNHDLVGGNGEGLVEYIDFLRFVDKIVKEVS